MIVTTATTDEEKAVALSRKRVVKLPYDFEPRHYQKELFRYILSRVKKYTETGDQSFSGGRAACVWHRRAGKDLTSLHLIAASATMRVGSYWVVYPFIKQARNAIWEGRTSQGKRFLDAFPPSLVASINHTNMTIRMKNGSIIQLHGADKPDSLVGTNPIGIVFSEWSLMKPEAWDLTRPILEENGGWAVFIYTPRGKNQGFSTFTDFSNNPDCLASLKTVLDTGALSKDQLQRIQADYDAEMYNQEFMCSFNAPMPGSYYSEELKAADEDGRITQVPFDRRHPVITVWDIGMSDYTAIWFVQLIGPSIRLIRYYQDNDKPVTFYAALLDHFTKTQGYQYSAHYAPWESTFFATATPTAGPLIAKSASGMGFNFRPVPMRNRNDGINAARELFARCYFDETNCASGLQALREYRKKFTPDDPTESLGPAKSWANHGADAFRYLAMICRNPEILDFTRKPKPLMGSHLPNQKIVGFDVMKA